MGRLIDADALRKSIETDRDASDMQKMWYEGIKYAMNHILHAPTIPTVELKQQWIPCSEKLPDDYTNVLVWFEYFRYGDYNCLYQIYGIGNYSTEYDSWMINHETGWRKLRVIAWMPLPEPYQEEGESDETD